MTATNSMPADLSALPGRLGDPNRSLATDPRVDPVLRQHLQALGLDANGEPSPVGRSSSREELHAAIGASHQAFAGLYEVIPLELPEDAQVKVTQETLDVPGEPGLQVHVFRPAGVDKPLPGVAYIHGGGMVILPTRARVHDQWCIGIAAAGSVAISIDFRNAWNADGWDPYPAGLEDCLRAVVWLSENREQLGLTSLVVQGESGGGNLTLATALKAKRDGVLDAIDGAYACVPYISGGYGWERERQLRELPSMIENNGYFIELTMMDSLVAAYDPEDQYREDPLAWPYFATQDDLAGLPPHVITVNELDPLRDEGLAYYRKLLDAGVETRGRVNLGIVHGAEMIFRQALASQFRSTVRDIVGFASDCAARRG